MDGKTAMRIDASNTQRADITSIKEHYAAIWDILVKLAEENKGNGEIGRAISVSKTELQTSSFFAVNAMTHPDYKSPEHE